MTTSKSDTSTDHSKGISASVLGAMGLAQETVGEDGSVAESGSTSDSEQLTEDSDAETETAAEGEAPEPGLPLDQVFEILKNRRRREVLHYLDENEGTATLSDLAEHIAAMENDTTIAAISSSQRKRVYVGLYQCHLPKMDDMNIVDFDQNRGTIALAENAEQLETYLEEEPPTRNWPLVYLGLALAAAGLFVVSQVGGAQLGLTPTVVLFGLIAGSVLCVGWQWRTEAEADSG